MALAGVAAADTAAEAQSTLESLISASEYITGESFTFSVTLDDASNGSTYCITLGGGYGVFIHQQKYFSLSNSTGNAAWYNSSVTVNEDGTATSLEIDAPSSTWFSYTIGNKTDEGYQISQAWENIDGATVTIGYDSKETETTITFAKDGVSNSLVVGNYSLNASDIAISDSPSFTNVSFTYTPAVPEPTTATLSLLALAGLAARRRRK